MPAHSSILGQSHKAHYGIFPQARTCWSPAGAVVAAHRQPSPGATCLRIASMTWAL